MLNAQFAQMIEATEHNNDQEPDMMMLCFNIDPEQLDCFSIETISTDSM